MANKIGARRNGRFKAVGTAPSINKTPRGPTSVPVGYPVFSDLTGSLGIVPNVRFNGDPVYVLEQSTQPSCEGDAEGTDKGVRSGTLSGEVKPVEGCATVRAGGKRIVREGDGCTLQGGNCPGEYLVEPSPAGSPQDGEPAPSGNPPVTDGTLREARRLAPPPAAPPGNKSPAPPWRSPRRRGRRRKGRAPGPGGGPPARPSGTGPDPQGSHPPQEGPHRRVVETHSRVGTERTETEVIRMGNTTITKTKVTGDSANGFSITLRGTAGHETTTIVERKYGIFTSIVTTTHREGLLKGGLGIGGSGGVGLSASATAIEQEKAVSGLIQIGNVQIYLPGIGVFHSIGVGGEVGLRRGKDKRKSIVAGFKVGWGCGLRVLLPMVRRKAKEGEPAGPDNSNRLEDAGQDA